MTRDPWRGNQMQPMSYNGWLYTYANPVNFTDPLGLCPGCYVFFFTGFANAGDVNGDNEYSLDEIKYPILQTLLSNLEQRTGAKVVPVYPYGIGLSEPDPLSRLKVLFDASEGRGLVPDAKASEILAFLSEEVWQDSCDGGNWPDLIVDSMLQITFLTYSGGGQIAYTTAQKLEGSLQIDKLVTLGSPYSAYKGVSNIGQLWELWGEYDLHGLDFGLGATGGFLYGIMGWKGWNEGYLHRDPIFDELSIPTPLGSIYTQGAARCIFNDTEESNYSHYSYFNPTEPDGGVYCTGESLYRRDATQGLSRSDAMLDFLVNVVGIGSP